MDASSAGGNGWDIPKEVMGMKRALFLFLGVFLLLVCWATVFKEDFTSLDYCDMSLTTGGWDIDTARGLVAYTSPPEISWSSAGGSGRHPLKLAVGGSYVCAADMDGLTRFDISTGAESGHITLPAGDAVDVALLGSYAYVAATNAFYSVDYVSSTMSIADNLTINALGVGIRGDSAYVGCGSSGLRCVDISDPTNLVNRDLLSWTNADARGVEIYSPDGTNYYAIVADRNVGIVYVDITPGSAGFMSTYHATALGPTGQGGFYLDINDTIAVVAAGDSIYVVGLGNVGTGSDLNILQRIKARHWAYDARIKPNYGFLVADGIYGVDWFIMPEDDYSKCWLACSFPLTTDPSATDTSAKGVDIVVLRNQLVVADSCGLQMRDFAPGDAVQPSSEWADVLDASAGWSYGEAVSMSYGNGYLFVSGQTYGVVAVDISDPFNLQVVGTLSLVPALGSDVEDDYLYLCTGGTSPNFYKIDVSSPSGMSVVSSATISGTATDVDVSGNYAYVACHNGVKKLDISSWPPSVVATYSSSAACVSVYYDEDEDSLYVAADENGLLVLKSSDLSLVAQYDSPGHCWGLAKRGGSCYIADKEQGVRKIDLSTMTSVWDVAFTSPSREAVSLALFGGYLAVGFLESPSPQDLCLIDTTDGSVDYWCPTTHSTYIGEALTIVGDYLFMADYSYGLKSWQLTGGAMPNERASWTRLYSKKINTSQFRYVHWHAAELQDGSDAASTGPQDTASYYLVYLSNPPAETLRIMNNEEDPPRGAGGTRLYFDLGALYDSLFWFVEVTEHNTSPTSADTLWSVDTVEIEYLQTLSLMRVAGELSAGGFSAGVVFDEGALVSTDSLDVPYSAGNMYWVLDGHRFTTISLPYDEPQPPLTLVLEHAAPVHIEGPITFIVDGDTIAEGTVIDEGVHAVVVIPPPRCRFVYRTYPGWNLISHSGTTPTTPQALGFDEAFWYDPCARSYVSADVILPGRGYFCYSEGGVATTDGIPTKRLAVPLEAGWNLVGGPGERVPVAALETQPPNSVLKYCVFSMMPRSYTYYIVDELLPRCGAWVFALMPCTLYIDPRAETTALERTTPERQISLTLRGEGGSQRLSLGVDPRATDGFDLGLDAPRPPQAPGSPTLGYLRAKGFDFGLALDARKPGSEWELVVLRRCRLFANADYRSGSILVCGEGFSAVVGSDGVELTPGTYRLSWLDEYILPRRAALSASPNPFNASVLLAVDLPCSRGAVDVFDLDGRRVAHFDLQGAGRHTLRWNGSGLPSGVYLVSLSSQAQRVWKKVVMLK